MPVDTLSQVPASQLAPDGATSAANNAAPKATALIKTKGLVKTFTSRKGATYVDSVILEQLAISWSRQNVADMGEPRARIRRGNRVERQTNRLP
jgi:hypothetical protein